jgi:HAE1 family hydrophobic/amphiphilic exporter-1
LVLAVCTNLCTNPIPGKPIFLMISTGAIGVNSPPLTGPLANRFREPERELDMRTRLQPADRESLQVLQNRTVPQGIASPGQPFRLIQVPIWPALRLKWVMGSTEIHRFNQRRALEISAETRNLDLYRTAALIQPELARISLPPGYDIRLGQSFEEMRQNRREIIFALFLGLTLIYMIMAALFESLITPLVIMCSVPLALVGIALALWITGYAVSIAVYVGALALAGIVVNNAIVMVDHINQLRAAGLAYHRAVLKGAQDRLRPILITSATPSSGCCPWPWNDMKGRNCGAPWPGLSLADSLVPLS